MPHFKSHKFYQNRPQIMLFCKKLQNYQTLGFPGNLQPPDPRNSLQTWQIPGYTRLILIMFSLISMSPEFSVIPRFKSVNFYQKKPKITGGASRPPKQPLAPLQILVMRLIINVSCQGVAHTSKI